MVARAIESQKTVVGHLKGDHKIWQFTLQREEMTCLSSFTHLLPQNVTTVSNQFRGQGSEID